MKKIKQFYEKHGFTILLISIAITVLSAALSIVPGLEWMQFVTYSFGAFYAGYLLYHGLRDSIKKLINKLK